MKPDSSAQASSEGELQLNWQWCSPPLGSILAEFCLETSLHGLKYLGQQKRHIIERLFWLTAFLSSVFTAGYLIWTMWKEYDDMPIVTVLDPTEKRLEEIPFPSVTICNVNNIQKSTFKNIISSATSIVENHNGGALTDQKCRETLATFVDMKLICDSTLAFLDNFSGDNASLDDYYEKTNDLMMQMENKIGYINPAEASHKVSQSCEEMILYCTWEEEIRNCSELFKKIETDYGICCTFNSVPLSALLRYNHQRESDNENESAEVYRGYGQIILTNWWKHRKYPYRQRSAGRATGLSFLLTPDLDEYYCPNTDSEGFMMGLNMPRDFPRMRKHSTAIPTGSEVFVAVQPDITMTEDVLRSFRPDRRNCYYGNEFHLRHYTIYSISNCRSECIARNVLEVCGCVLYFMPRDQNNTLCKPHEYECAENVQKNISATGLSSICKECLPTCNRIQYHKEVSHLRLQRKRVTEFLQGRQNKSLNAQDVSIVHVYVRTDSIYPKVRKQMTTITQLISNAGGLLGLFLGFSVLSLLEICYYGSMRLCFSYYLNRKTRDLQNGNDTSGRDKSQAKCAEGEDGTDGDVFRIRNRRNMGVQIKDSIEERIIGKVMTNCQHVGFIY